MNQKGRPAALCECGHPDCPRPPEETLEDAAIEKARAYYEASFNTSGRSASDPRAPELMAEFATLISAEDNARLTALLAKYKEALADAIRSPMGVCPDSVQGLLNEADLYAAERRRAALKEGTDGKN